MRAVLWRLLWGLAFLIWSPGFRVSGRIPRCASIFVANHNSHADTAAIQLALARAGHGRMLAAGAEDYFFRNNATAALSRIIGVFPFPRSGRDGVERSRKLLRSGHSVLLFPQGSRDGGPFRRGVAHLADSGRPVVPVTIEGTDLVLPKGAHWPRKGQVSLRFGEPLNRTSEETPEEFTARLEDAVMRPTKVAA